MSQILDITVVKPEPVDPVDLEDTILRLRRDNPKWITDKFTAGIMPRDQCGPESQSTSTTIVYGTTRLCRVPTGFEHVCKWILMTLKSCISWCKTLTGEKI